MVGKLLAFSVDSSHLEPDSCTCQRHAAPPASRAKLVPHALLPALLRHPAVHVSENPGVQILSRTQRQLISLPISAMTPRQQLDQGQAEGARSPKAAPPAHVHGRAAQGGPLGALEILTSIKPEALGEPWE